MASEQDPATATQSVAPTASVKAAAERMRDAGVGVLSVRDGQDALGVITDRDLVTHVIAEGRDPIQTQVIDVVTAAGKRPASERTQANPHAAPPRTWRSTRPHPWHGLAVGPRPPDLVHAYVEITPFDLVKYELDKPSGCLAIDRPQLLSSLPPTVYGFIPRTLCGRAVAALASGAQAGDGDPLDICVLSERSILRGDLLLRVHVVGGLSTIDSGRADDKIIAVLVHDPVWGDIEDIHQLPAALVVRLRHYFGSYKAQPGQKSPSIVAGQYGVEHARQVVTAAMDDYAREFAGPDEDEPDGTP